MKTALFALCIMKVKETAFTVKGLVIMWGSPRKLIQHTQFTRQDASVTKTGDKRRVRRHNQWGRNNGKNNILSHPNNMGLKVISVKK